MQADNFGFILLDRALARRDSPAFVSGDTTITCGRFADLTIHFARRMAGSGVGPGSTVGLLIDSQLVAAVATSALALLGASWLALPAGEFPGRLDAAFVVPLAARPTWTAIDRSWLDAPVAEFSALEEFPGFRESGDTWMYASSSGTTGRRKYMPLSYDLTRKRMSFVESDDGTEQKIALLFPALSYVSSRIKIGNILSGCVNVALDWNSLVSNGVDRIIGSPSHFASQVFNQVTPEKRFKSCKVTGALVTDKFVNNALRYFEEVVVLYGATEAGVVSIGRFNDGSKFDGSVGSIQEGVRVEVLDPEGKPCSTGSLGRIRISSPWVIKGYYKRPDLDDEFFRDGWFYPQDLGTIDKGGRLRVVGRTADIVSNGGAKVNAADLDKIIQASPAVADGCSISELNDVGVEVVSALVQLRPGHDVSELKNLNLEVDRLLGRKARLFRTYVTDKIPRNANGKALRAEAAKMVLGLRPADLH